MNALARSSTQALLPTGTRFIVLVLSELVLTLLLSSIQSDLLDNLLPLPNHGSCYSFDISPARIISDVAGNDSRFSAAGVSLPVERGTYAGPAVLRFGGGIGVGSLDCER